MPQVFAGPILLRDAAPEGWVAVEDGVVLDWDEGTDLPETPVATGTIVPGLVNAHTHAADAFLRDVRGKPPNIPELVGPGGWKHRQLAMARRGRMGRGVARYAQEMASVGTSAFIDFRENGLSGVRFLRDLAEGAGWMAPEEIEPLFVPPFILGRPNLNDFDEEEAVQLLEEADGVGLSGMRDFPEAEDLISWADAAHRAGKPLSVHVSEDRNDDLDGVLALDPAFIVHMVHAHRNDILLCADAALPIVVCPRSNRFFGHRPPVPAMVEQGCILAVGTDNGMLQDGDLLAELRQLQTWWPGLHPHDLLRMASYNGRDLLGLPDPFQKGSPADLVVLPGDPLHGVPQRPGFTGEVAS